MATDFDSAVRVLRDGGVDGVGVVLVDGAGYVALDIDGCRDRESGALERSAVELVAGAGSFAEVSPSGRGVHVFVRGKLPKRGMRNGRIELYAGGRFIAMTGHRIYGSRSGVETRQQWLDGVVGTHFAGRRSLTRLEKEGCDRFRVSGCDGAIDLHDEEILARAAANPKFLPLWAGSNDGYSSPSDGDAALAQLLRYWTDGDAERMDRLFRRSGRMRPKWDDCHSGDGQSYGQLTIDFAIRTARSLDADKPAPGGTDKQPAAKQTPVYISVSHNSVRAASFSATSILKKRRIDSAPKELKRELLGLARRLKTSRELIGKGHEKHKPWVRRWCKQNAKYLGRWDWQTIWAAYCMAFGSTKSLAGQGKLDKLYAEALAAPLPSVAVRYDSAAAKGRKKKLLLTLQNLCRLCARLQAAAGAEPFWIGARDAADLLCVSRATAARHLATLVRDGVTELVSVGCRCNGRVSEYRMRKTEGVKIETPTELGESSRRRSF